MPAVLVFNKIDLLDDAGLEELHYLMALYSDLGYPCYGISARQLQGEDNKAEVKQLIDTIFSSPEGKYTLLSGNSGVGKSTLLNALFGREITRTGIISDAHDKGMHTTTFSEMYFLPEPANGAVIDTPGIKGFGTFDFQKEEVGHYFREIFRLSADCRFGNCTHCGEPGCAVVPALENGRIAPSRFDSYLSLLGDCTETKYR